MPNKKRLSRHALLNCITSSKFSEVFLSLLSKIQHPSKILVCCLCIAGLSSLSAQVVRSASITAEGDIVSGGVSIHDLKAIICDNAVLLGSPPLCDLQPGERFVFATSDTSNTVGNLGGLSGADNTCNTLATAAGLPGRYAAWLSTSNVDAKDRVGNHKWINTNGEVVADNLADLTDGSLDNAILYDENGIVANTDGTGIYTGTLTNGQTSNSNACNDWTSGSSGLFHSYGEVDSSDGGWTNEGVRSCAVLQRIYCFGL